MIASWMRTPKVKDQSSYRERTGANRQRIERFLPTAHRDGFVASDRQGIA